MQILPVFNYNFQPKLNLNIGKHATPTFCAHLDKDLFVSIKENKSKPNIQELEKKYLTPDCAGSLPIHYAKLKETKKINNALKDYPKLLAKMYLTKNMDGNLPIHCADLEEMKEINNALKDQPEVLAKMYLTQDMDGHLPIHMSTWEKMKEINNALKDQPEVLAKMYMTRNHYGKLPIDCYNYLESWVKEIHRVIYELATNSDLDSEISIKLLKTHNFNGRYSDEIETLKRQQ